MVLGGDNSLEGWRELDEKVNQYPTERSFKAIGMGGEDFVQSMVGAVESAVGSTVQPSRVQQRPSAKGKYISVTIGPVMMQNSDQVIKVYSEMREDRRLKWYL
jgi:putative lipoic acid-binding regulatory protein